MCAFTDSVLLNITEFQHHGFVDDVNFDQFLDLISGENDDPAGNFQCGFGNRGKVDNQLVSVPEVRGDVFEYDAMNINCDPIPLLRTFDRVNDGDDSSATTCANTPATPPAVQNGMRRPKADRSKTLISERRRRGRLKEKLYALRTLVPTITKMDKASIVGDAALYVQDLQSQATNLKNEVEQLEASLHASEKVEGSFGIPRIIQVSRNDRQHCKKLMLQMDVFQVEERGFYVRVVSNRGEGVAASLYKALESLTSFRVQSPNLTSGLESYVLTFTLNVTNSDKEINLPNLKLWVTAAFVSQDFEFMTSFRPSFRKAHGISAII